MYTGGIEYKRCVKNWELCLPLKSSDIRRLNIQFEIRYCSPFCSQFCIVVRLPVDIGFQAGSEFLSIQAWPDGRARYGTIITFIFPSKNRETSVILRRCLAIFRSYGYDLFFATNILQIPILKIYSCALTTVSFQTFNPRGKFVLLLIHCQNRYNHNYVLYISYVPLMEQ